MSPFERASLASTEFAAKASIETVVNIATFMGRHVTTNAPNRQAEAAPSMHRRLFRQRNIRLDPKRACCPVPHFRRSIARFQDRDGQGRHIRGRRFVGDHIGEIADHDGASYRNGRWRELNYRPDDFLPVLEQVDLNVFVINKISHSTTPCRTPMQER